MSSIISTVLDSFNKATLQNPDMQLKPNLNVILDKKKQIASAFSTGVWNIEFTKVDGTVSTMSCTLDSAIIPTSATLNEGVRNYSQDVIRVYSPDRNGWRSFKVENLIAMSPQI